MTTPRECFLTGRRNAARVRAERWLSAIFVICSSSSAGTLSGLAIPAPLRMTCSTNASALVIPSCDSSRLRGLAGNLGMSSRSFVDQLNLKSLNLFPGRFRMGAPAQRLYYWMVSEESQLRSCGRGTIQFPSAGSADRGFLPSRKETRVVLPGLSVRKRRDRIT